MNRADWYPRTVRFMRSALRQGGRYRVGPRSKFRDLAIDLSRRGMLRLESYSSAAGACYRVTEAGRSEFG